MPDFDMEPMSSLGCNGPHQSTCPGKTDATIQSMSDGPPTPVPGGTGLFPRNRGGVVDKQAPYGNTLSKLPDHSQSPPGVKAKYPNLNQPVGLKSDCGFGPNVRDSVNATDARTWPE